MNIQKTNRIWSTNNRGKDIDKCLILDVQMATSNATEVVQERPLAEEKQFNEN